MTGDDVPALVGWIPGADLPALAAGEVRVWIVDLDAGMAATSDPEAVEPGPELAVLSDDERARAARFVRARERRRFARCRATLRAILGRLLDEPPGSLQFRAAAMGKPELDRGPEIVETLRFNVSHSADLAAIAVCRGREVGVDLERVRQVGEAERIVESFFTAAEQTAFAAIPEADRDAAFIRGWTRKEAVLKAFGMGISGLAARHETGFSTTPLTTRFRPADPVCHVDRWMLWEATPRAEFYVALAVDADDSGSASR